MGKIKKFANIQIRKIRGGKDPIRLIDEFIGRRGFDPQECARERTPESARWMIPYSEGEELELLAEGLSRANDTTIYMGINVATVPVRGAGEMLSAALEVADGLIGIKVSLVGHYLVLSASFPAASVSVEDLDYNLEIITAQRSWFREALADELGIETLPDE